MSPRTRPTRPARGRTRWPLFSVVSTSAVATTSLLVVPTLLAAPLPVVPALSVPEPAGGSAAVTLASVHRRPLKLSVDSFTAAGVVPATGAFETRDGGRRTELLLHLRDLTVRGLCLSNRVRTPVGSYTLRITSPTFTADRLTLALDGVDGIDVLGRQLGTGRLLDPLPPSGPSLDPLAESGPSLVGLPLAGPPPGGSDEPGFLSLRIGTALTAVTVTLRYLTGSHVAFGGLRMAGGRGDPECF